MIREWLGIVALNALLVAVGTSLLTGLGLVRRVRDGIRFSGLALVLGWAVLGVAASYTLMLGARLSVGQILLLAALLGALGILAARRVRALPPRARGFATGPAERVVAFAGAAALLVYLEPLFLRARLAEPSRWDTWAFWVPKAMSLVYFDGLDTGVGGFTSFANPDYPPLKPAMDATAFRIFGEVDPGALPLENAILAAGFVGGVAALLAGRVRPAVLWPSLAVLAVLPDFDVLMGSLLADESLALLFALAGVCGALWLVEREVRFAVLTALFLSAGALVKNEGLMLALIVFVLLAAVTRGREWRRLVPLAALPILAVIPWQVWMDANEVPEGSAFQLGDLIRPEYLLHRTHRFAVALHEVPPVLLAYDRWLLTVPLVALVAAVLVRRRPELLAYVAGTLVLGVLGFATVYWASTYPLGWYIETTAERIVSSLALFGAALFPLLVSEALEPDGPDSVR